jgi:prolyl-tRNA editing enzyme YbaK/EbsC (Cys-tRNA(Pro) deacylase)
MWPAEVERVAGFLRGAGVEGRLEELAPEEATPPAPFVRAEAFRCHERTIVGLVPADRELDRGKLLVAARCTELQALDPPSLPYAGARVLVDRLLLGDPVVWVEAGSPRHVVSLTPAQLVELTHAAAAELVVDA